MRGPERLYSSRFPNSNTDLLEARGLPGAPDLVSRPSHQTAVALQGRLVRREKALHRITKQYATDKHINSLIARQLRSDVLHSLMTSRDAQALPCGTALFSQQMPQRIGSR
jgi:hypothetical protein